MGIQSHLIQSDLAQRITGAKTFEDATKLLVSGQRAKTHFKIKDRDLLDPTALSPAEGDHYLMPSSGAIAGAWASAGLLNDEIAAFSNAAWQRYTPAKGDTVDVLDEDRILRFSGTEWLESGGVADNDIRSLGVLVGDGVTDENTLVSAAIAAGGRWSIPAGKTVLAASLAFATVGGVAFAGPGQVKAGAFKLAPYHTTISAPPTLGAQNSIQTAFDGDLTTTIARGHYVTGATTLGQPSTGYLIKREASAYMTYMHVDSSTGFNADPAGNGGRTGVAAFATQVFQAGNGDAYCNWGSVFVSGTRAGATDVLASPTGVIYGGQVFAGAHLAYCNNIEQNSSDSTDGGVTKFRASAGTFVCNHTRYESDATIDGAGGTITHFWNAYSAQSSGTQFTDAGFSASGKIRIPFEATRVTLGTEKCVLAIPQTGRIYFNATLRATGAVKITGSLGNTYLSDDGAKINFVYSGVSRFQINTEIVAAVTTNLTVATGSTTRAGLVLNSIQNADGQSVGLISFSGHDSGGNFQEYATVEGVINSATAETGAIALRVSPGSGTMQAVARFQSDGAVLYNAGALPPGGFAGAGILNAHGLRVNNVSVALLGANTFTAAQTLSGAALNITNIQNGIVAYGPNDSFPIYSFSTYSDPTVAGATWHNTFFQLRRARGTQAAPAAVTNGDGIGALEFFGYGSGGFARSAQILAAVDGTVGAQVPSRIDFLVAPDSTTVAAIKMSLRASGRLGIGETQPDYLLDVNGAIGFTPGASVTPVDNGDIVFEATNNTTFTIKMKGSDGTVRSGTVTLA